jgi:hypothetical protein
MPTNTFLTRQQKRYKMDGVFPLDANSIDIDEGLGRLLIYLRTGGRQINFTDKAVFRSDAGDGDTPAAVVSAVLGSHTARLTGFASPERQALISKWFESNFALSVQRRKNKTGQPTMSGLRPLHSVAIKLFNPRVKRGDRYWSDFLYNAISPDFVLYAQPDSLFRGFFELGVDRQGECDLRIDEDALNRLANSGRLDVELLFLLRLTEPFEVDRFSTKKEDAVPKPSFLCPEQIELLGRDLQLLFLYREHVPRRELISYMTTLLVFHTALYFMQVVKMTNAMVASGIVPASRGNLPGVGTAKTHAPFDLNLFCDMANGHNLTVKNLAERCHVALFREVEDYFRSAYYMKKLEEFASPTLSSDQKSQQGKAYAQMLLSGFRKDKNLDGHFNRDISEILLNSADQDTERPNEEVERIIEVCKKRGLNKLETFVEILTFFQYPTLRDQHRKLMSSLCGLDLERGFLAGRGRAKRRFVIGNELLEVLIQLAVLEQRQSDAKFQTHPIPIRQFVDWLGGRYGLLVDRLSLQGDEPEDEQVNRALAGNFEALKVRLRQLGFFTDLADASNSQVISPRFPISDGEIPLANVS